MELPKEDEIKAMALENLPEHYALKAVRLTYGSDWPGAIPEDFEITIEYEYRGDEALRGTFAEIETFQNWAEPLKAMIRNKWPPKALRICFSEKGAKEEEHS